MAKYLVTGASGFVGQHLIAHLAEAGHEVFGVVRTKGKLKGPATEVVADLTKTGPIVAEVAKIKPDGIFHLAAPETSVGHSWQSPAETLSANLDSTLSVLEAAHLVSGGQPKVLFVSSGEVVGIVDEKEQPIAEGTPPVPTNPYALSKLMGEGAVTLYFRQFEVPALIVRPFTHIGPGQRDSFVVQSFAKQVAEAESSGGGEIKVGNLSARRDFSDVRDIAAAYLVVMEQGTPGEVYHSASGDVRSIEDIAKFLAGASPGKISIVVDPERVRPNDIPLLAGDATKLRSLGWKPAIKLETTLQEILEAARAAITKKATKKS